MHLLEGLWSRTQETSDIEAARDAKALARSCLSLRPTCLQYVRNATNAKEAWEALCKIFEDRGFYRRVVLLRRLHRIQYNEFSSMNEYIEAVMSLVEQLHEIGRTIEDAEVAELLLSGLPQEFDIIVASLETATMSNGLTSELDVSCVRYAMEHTQLTSRPDVENQHSNALFRDRIQELRE